MNGATGGQVPFRAVYGACKAWVQVHSLPYRVQRRTSATSPGFGLGIGTLACTVRYGAVYRYQRNALCLSCFQLWRGNARHVCYTNWV